MPMPKRKSQGSSLIEFTLVGIPLIFTIIDLTIEIGALSTSWYAGETWWVSRQS
jgi:hypothetical protein